jgi:hypothetical protein
MQRAAASSNRSPSTATNTPIRDSTGPPSAKRQKLTDSEPSTPGTPTFAAPHSTELHVVSAALAAEEKSRSEARVRSAAAGGETEWILDLPSVNGSTNGNLRAKEDSAGRAQEDEEAAEDEIWRDHTVGRRSYGGFKRKKTQAGTPSSKEAGEEDDEELSEVDVSDVEAGVLQHSTKIPMALELNKERAEAKRWQAMDKMNLKKQNHIWGFSPKGALDDRKSKVKKKHSRSFKS